MVMRISNDKLSNADPRKRNGFTAGRPLGAASEEQTRIIRDAVDSVPRLSEKMIASILCELREFAKCHSGFRIRILRSLVKAISTHLNIETHLLIVGDCYHKGDAEDLGRFGCTWEWRCGRDARDINAQSGPSCCCHS